MPDDEGLRERLAALANHFDGLADSARIVAQVSTHYGRGHMRGHASAYNAAAEKLRDALAAVGTEPRAWRSEADCLLDAVPAVAEALAAVERVRAELVRLEKRRPILTEAIRVLRRALDGHP